MKKPLASWEGDEISDLRAVYEAIRNNFSKREEYFKRAAPEPKGNGNGRLAKDKIRSKAKPETETPADKSKETTGEEPSNAAIPGWQAKAREMAKSSDKEFDDWLFRTVPTNHHAEVRKERQVAQDAQMTLGA